MTEENAMVEGKMDMMPVEETMNNMKYSQLVERDPSWLKDDILRLRRFLVCSLHLLIHRDPYVINVSIPRDMIIW